MLPLLAEFSNDLLFVVVPLASLLGGGVVWVSNYYAGLRAEKRTNKLADEKTIVDHLSTVNARIDRENMSLHNEIRSLGLQVTRAIAHVMYLEGMMEAKGIKFRPFSSVPTGETAEHKPVPHPHGQFPNGEVQ